MRALKWVLVCVRVPGGSLGAVVWGVEENSSSDLDLSVIPGAGTSLCLSQMWLLSAQDKYHFFFLLLSSWWM